MLSLVFLADVRDEWVYGVHTYDASHGRGGLHPGLTLAVPLIEIHFQSYSRDGDEFAASVHAIP